MAKLGIEEADKVRQSSAERGRQLHQLIECYYTGTPLVPTQASYPYLLGFQKLLSEQKVTPVYIPTKAKGVLSSIPALEYKVSSERYGYAGTLDGVMYINERGPYLVDWKTSSNHYDEYRLQTSAYVNAFLEMHDDIPIIGRKVFRFTAEGGYHEVDHKLQGEDFSDFLHCKALFDRRLRYDNY